MSTETPDQTAFWNAFSARLFDQNLFAIKLGLDNIRRALTRDGHPELSAPAIVVGGTNGKGTTAALLSNILQAHGLRVGFSSSPHLLELRERFRIDGAPVDRATVMRVGGDVMNRYAQPDGEVVLTFFELTTLMAAHIFNEADVDVAVYEVGLGGRLDAVNAIEPAVTIVTTIDLDHQVYLGDTVAKIAAEKAALFRPGVASIIGPQDHQDALDVLVEAAPHAVVAGRDFPVDNSTLRRRHQGTAVEAARAFLGDKFRAQSAQAGIAQTVWPGRMQRLAVATPGLEGPWLVDAAHNPAGARNLHAALAREEVGAFVVSAAKDKDLSGLFADIPPDVPTYGVKLRTERGASREALQGVIPRLRGTGTASLMLEAARAAAGDKLIVVYGSLYLLGEVFECFGHSADDMRSTLGTQSGRSSDSEG
ncbi:MAG: Mur ligase family protein [bacterium]